jgi:hypothetical protein
MHRPNGLGPATQFRLEAGGLVVNSGPRERVFPYADITEIRLMYAPANMAGEGYRAKIRARNGQSATITNLHWKSIAELEYRNQDYCALMRELCARAEQQNPAVHLAAGHHRLRHRLLLAGTFGVGLLLSLIGLYVITSHWMANDATPARTPLYVAAIAMALVAYLVWWSLRYFSRNRPRPFVATAIPQGVLPPG